MTNSIQDKKSNNDTKTKPQFEILVADDDYNTVDVFSEYLELMGHKVIAKAYDGKQAFELYKNTLPDFVFLDMMMPEYDGFYALERIKKHNSDSHVIAITADLTKDIEEKLEKMGIDAIIYKPFDMDSIISVMEKVYQKSHTETHKLS